MQNTVIKLCTYTQSLFCKVIQFLMDFLLNRFFFLKLLLTFIQQNLTKSYIFFHTVFFNNNFFLHKRNKIKKNYPVLVHYTNRTDAQ